MALKTIAISTDNYQILKNMGKAGDSFNDVITHLVKKCRYLRSMNDEKLLLQSDQSPAKAQSDCSLPRET
jgi:predicted CopG family antitoxin